VSVSRAKAWKGLFGVLILFLPALALAYSGSGPCSEQLSSHIPGRSGSASDGSGFAERIRGLHGAERDALIRDELVEGNLPGFLRRLDPVTVTGTDAAGHAVRVTFCVMPDYLSIGSDKDFLRIPMGLDTAVTVASDLGFVLPTPKMVDAIYRSSSVHLAPKPMTPGAEMTSTDYYQRHNRTVDQQRLAKGAELGRLTAGQKKDLVLTNRLRSHPGRVAIYGWHCLNGKPIQPLSTVHGLHYADYSHGIRLVSDTVFVDGRSMSIVKLLQDPQLAGLLNSEGPIPRLAGLLKELAGQGSEVRTARSQVAQRLGGDS